MKAIAAALAVALTLLVPVQTFAACPTISGPFSCCGSAYWHEYEWDNTCAGTTGSVSTTTMSCFSKPGHAITGTSGTIIYSHTVQATDPVNNTAKWSVSLWRDFDDPNNSATNTLSASVSVNHNGSVASYPIFSHNGSIGDLSCSRKGYFYFTAVVGDTITVTITGANHSANTIKASQPILFNEL